MFLLRFLNSQKYIQKYHLQVKCCLFFFIFWRIKFTLSIIAFSITIINIFIIKQFRYCVYNCWYQLLLCYYLHLSIFIQFFFHSCSYILTFLKNFILMVQFIFQFYVPLFLFQFFHIYKMLINILEHFCVLEYYLNMPTNLKHQNFGRVCCLQLPPSYQNIISIMRLV